MIRQALWIAFVLIAGLAGSIVVAGELDAVRESVRGEPDSAGESPPKRSRHHRKSSSDDCDEEDGFFTLLFSKAAAVVITSPWTVPLLLTGDNYEEPAVVVREPYLQAPFAMATEVPDGSLPPVFGRLQLDFATNFGDLDRAGGQLLLETPSRWGLDTSWSNWQADRGGTIDSLLLGDANLVFRFAQSEDLQFRTGIGFNWMSDRFGGEFGFNFTHGFDYYPKPPWVISSTIDWGTLGNAGLFHNQTTVGYLFRRCEIFTGVDYYRIGHGELSGWLTGIRYRF